VGLLKTSRKFSNVHEWTIFPVKESRLQNAEMKRTTSAARYSSRNHASGADRSAVARSHGLRQNAAERRRRAAVAPRPASYA
jgi:hypothetical protein